MQLSQVLPYFPDSRPVAGGYESRCPAHDDNRASLSLSPADNGGVVLHCHAGCSVESVTSAVGLTLADLMPAKEQRSQLVATYDYVAEDGELLYQVCRFQPKDFRQRRPDGTGWKWSIKGVRRVLYMLPELLAADSSRIVFVCEGEKDVDTLAKIGAVATTNAGGAGKGKWLDEYSDALAGRKVVILPDNDEPGRTHTELVARSLTGKAASVKVLTLPGLPDKGDVSDFLAAGGTLTDLERLASERAEWKPASESDLTANKSPATTADVQMKDVSYQLFTAAQLDCGSFDLQYLVDGLFVEGQPGIVGGGFKTLKTTITADLAVSLASGADFLNAFPVLKKKRTCFMSAESGLGTLQESFRRICKSKGRWLSDLDDLLISPDLPKIGDARHHLAVEKLIQDNGIGVLIFDPLYLSLLATDPGNLFSQGILLREIADVCQSLNVTFLALHHTKKTLVNPHAPPELGDLSWSGTSEFSRQWLLLSRRERYLPGSGQHALWFAYGGSAGHSGEWCLDVNEGEAGSREWNVTLRTASDVRDDATQQREAESMEKRAAKSAAKCLAVQERILEALTAAPDYTETRRNIRERTGAKGTQFDEALAALVREERITLTEVGRSNGQKYDAYRLSI